MPPARPDAGRRSEGPGQRGARGQGAPARAATGRVERAASRGRSKSPVRRARSQGREPGAQVLHGENRQRRHRDPLQRRTGIAGPVSQGRFQMRLISAVLLFSCTVSAHAADPALLSAAKSAEPAVVQTLKDLVSIESGSANVAGLTRMADYVEARLKAAGGTTERLKATSGPGGPIVRATFTGTGKKRILLLGHLDTVYPEGILATQPIKTDGNKLYGPGIADDKGGLAVILHSLEILKASGWRDYATLTVLLNPDEEIGSGGSGDLIAKIAADRDFVLSCEPTAAKAIAREEGVLLGASGTGMVTMEVTGRQSHAGAAPEQGRNALVELSYQVLQTRDVEKGVAGTQLNWTYAQSGSV